MAEAIARAYLDSATSTARDVFVASAGTAASDGAPVTPETLAALTAMGIQHSGSSKRLSADMIRRADAIFGMTEGHVAAARQLVAPDANAMSRIVILDPEGDIEDPIGLGQNAYDEVADRLRRVIPKRMQEVLRS